MIDDTLMHANEGGAGAGISNNGFRVQPKVGAVQVGG